MIAHNMCYSTVILDPKYLNLPETEYSTIAWTDSDGKDFSFSFVQNQPGILSGILQSLWKNRKVTKKEMNATTDPFMKIVLNAKQLAIKVTMNSIYGFTGATVGALPCLEISQSVTGCGRQMIEETQNYAKTHFQCEIVYGDSVSSDTPVLIRKNGNRVMCIEIKQLFESGYVKEYPQFKLGEEGLFNKEQSIYPDSIEIWTASGWSLLKRTIRHNCSKNMYRIVTRTGVVDVTEDHSLLTLTLKEIKPNEILIGNKLFHSFPSDILPDNTPIDYYYSTSSKIDIQQKYIQARSLVRGVEIIYKNGMYSLRYYDELQVNNHKEIKEVIDLGPAQDYVYDLETEDGTFQAGIGQMIVKNTDSCYVIFPEPVDPDGTLTTLFKKAKFVASEISKTFKKPIELEFEKFMYPLILVAKKRYMYLEWTDPKNHSGEIEAKGVELVRRDNCGYVKETLDAVLTPIMFKNDVKLGQLKAEEFIDRLLNGEVPIKKLILSKNLRNDYAKPETIAHYQLVEKMKLRDPGSAPKPGDRVPFVYVDIGNPKALSWKKVEDPEYVIQNNLPIDTLYYLEHQLKNPLKTIFDILLGTTKCDELFNRKSFLDAKRREKASIGEVKRKTEGNKDIRSFYI